MADKKQKSETTTIDLLLDEIPLWYYRTKQALSLVQSNYKKWQQPKAFILLLLVLATSTPELKPNSEH